MDQTANLLRPIGIVRSPLKRRKHAPRQGSQGAPDTWLEINPIFADGLSPAPSILVSDNLEKLRGAAGSHLPPDPPTTSP